MADGNPDTYIANIISFGERATIGAGLARYLAAAGGSNLGSELAAVITRDGTLGALRWSATSSGLTGNGHRLTVLVNGVATTLAVTWNGMATFGANASDRVAVKAGDRVAVQVQLTAGGTSITRPRVSFELEVEGVSPWISDGPDVYFDGGNVGIGTSAPGERLTVDGIVESTAGFKFPDGTLQTTAAAGGGGGVFALQAADGTPAVAVYVDDDGRVGVGTTTPTAGLTLAAGADLVVDLPTPDDVTLALVGGGSLSDGAECHFQIVACDGVKLSAGSQEVAARATRDENRCRLSWAPVPGAIGYRVYKGSAPGVPSLWRPASGTSLDWDIDVGANPVTASDRIPPRPEAYVNKLASDGDSWLLGGRLGLGTATPTATLDVAGGLRVRPPDTSTALTVDGKTELRGGARAQQLDVDGPLGVAGPVTASAGLKVNGTLGAGATLDVGGAMVLAGNLTAGGAINMVGPLNVSAQAHANGGLSVTGDLGVSGAIGVGGMLTASSGITASGTLTVNGTASLMAGARAGLTIGADGTVSIWSANGVWQFRPDGSLGLYAIDGGLIRSVFP